MDAILSITNERVVPVLEQWGAVDTVLVLRFGGDRYDPSFFISYDVCFRDDIPQVDQREKDLSFVVSFETTLDGQKDRFLVDDVPVRLEYKSIPEIDGFIADAFSHERTATVMHDTYGFFRIVHGQELLVRSEWLQKTREELKKLPDHFWDRQVWFHRARMDHSLADLSSAAFAGEELFFQLSLAAFLQNLSSLLFAINRQFEPSGRSLRPALQDLAVQPEEFGTRLEYLLNSDGPVNRKRKREIAQLIARSVLRLQ